MTSDYREESEKAKQAKRGVTEQRSGPGRSKRKRPIVVQYRSITKQHGPWKWPAEWTKWGAYRTEEEAAEAMNNCARKYAQLWQFRLQPVIKKTDA